jgi:hypothetical protein
MLSTLRLPCAHAIDKKCLIPTLKRKISMGKLWKVFYSIRLKHGSNNTEENKWVNVQNVQQKFQSQKRHGKWLVVQIKLENACN